jgi:hypothetical protein
LIELRKSAERERERERERIPDEGERGLGKRREEKVRWVLVDATAAIA